MGPAPSPAAGTTSLHADVSVSEAAGTVDVWLGEASQPVVQVWQFHVGVPVVVMSATCRNWWCSNLVVASRSAGCRVAIVPGGGAGKPGYSFAWACRHRSECCVPCCGARREVAQNQVASSAAADKCLQR